MVKERYMFACRDETLAQAPIRALITLLQGPEISRMIGPVPGYALDHPGEVTDFRDAAEWVTDGAQQDDRAENPA